MSHLTHDEIREAVEGTLVPARVAHAAGCTACTREIGDLRAVADELRAIDVPEPSPLFWEHLSGRVRAAVAQAPLPVASPWWRRGWLGAPLPAAGALVALAAVGIALAMSLRSDTGHAPASATEREAAAEAGGDAPDLAESAAGPELLDEEWGFVVAVAEGIGLDDSQADGLTSRLGHSELAVAQLSAEERVELVRLLNEALSHGAG